MSTVLFAIILLAAVIIGGVVVLYSQNYSGLQIENPYPLSLTLTQYDEPEISFSLRSYENSTWNNVVMHAETQYDPSNYLQLNSKSFGMFTIGENGKQIEQMKPVRALNSEGYEIRYNTDLVVYANDEEQDRHEITVKIVPDFVPDYRDLSRNNSGELEFIDLNINDLRIPVGKERSIEFKIKSFGNNEYDSIKVVPKIENHSGKFVEANELSVNEVLNKNGEETGNYSITVKAIKSVADSLKYKLNLILYNNNIQMDSKQIDLQIVP